jgi:tRNA A37 threonylcarbamoyladenosine modification protein TsaB
MKIIDKKILLGINTAVADEAAVFLFNGKEIKKEITKEAKDKIVFLIDKIFKKNKKTLEKIMGVAVVSGPGPFTAVRSGVVAANMLGNLLDVPVVGIKQEEFKNEKEFLEIGYGRIIKGKGKKIVLPAYGKEPNITKPKKWKF